MHRFHTEQKKRLKKYKLKWHEIVAKYLSLKQQRRLQSTKRFEKRERKKQRLIKQHRAMEMAVICNEFTNDRFPHSHSHLYLKTKNPKTFKAIKRF